MEHALAEKCSEVLRAVRASETYARLGQTLLGQELGREEDAPWVAARYLEQHSGKVAKAAKALEATLLWREEYGADTVLDEDFGFMRDVLETYPQFLHRYTRDGRPLFFERTGAIDVRRMLQVTDFESLLRAHVAFQEWLQRVLLPRASARAGQPVRGMVSVMDLKGLSAKQLKPAVHRYVKAVTALDEAHYPSLIEKTYIIRTPWAFAAVWKIIRPLLGAKTVEKLEIFGNSKCEERLAAAVGPEGLPSAYGGECVCADSCAELGCENEADRRAMFYGRAEAAVVAAAEAAAVVAAVPSELPVPAA